MWSFVTLYGGRVNMTVRLTGSQGPLGPAGPQGGTGPDGGTGPPGATGPQGSIGNVSGLAV